MTAGRPVRATFGVTGHNGTVTSTTDPTDPVVSPTSLEGTPLPEGIAALLKRTPDGLVPAIAQDASTGRVLMMAWMNDEALARTLATGRGTYWSRSRNKYWVKGEESGHRQWVRRVELDCDGDTLLLQVDQEGAACHLGTTSCFDTHVLALGTPAEGQPTEGGRR